MPIPYSEKSLRKVIDFSKQRNNMKIGIGISLNNNAREAAIEAVAQASLAVSEPTLAIVFGSIQLQQDQIYDGLLEAGLKSSILFGGSSYAEISPAGVTQKSIAVLLVELPEANIRTVSVPLQDDPQTMSKVLIDALGDWQTDTNYLNVGLLFSSMSAGRENEMLTSLRNSIGQLAIFGGMACGNYDLGMGHPEFWTNYQYCDGAFQKHVRLAVLQLPRNRYNVAFGCGHGWEPLGPTHIITRSEESNVYEIDGIPIFDFYRQFLGRDAGDQFFELLVQRYGIALQLEETNGPRTTVKIPVKMDRQAGCMTFYPVENLQGLPCKLNPIESKKLDRWCS